MQLDVDVSPPASILHHCVKNHMLTVQDILRLQHIKLVQLVWLFLEITCWVEKQFIECS